MPDGSARAAALRLMLVIEQVDPTCPRCFRIISPDHSIMAHGVRLLHLDCDRPRALTFEECALLYSYCWDHAVADCVACARTYRRGRLEADLSLCPCRSSALTHRRLAHRSGRTSLPP